MDIIKILLFAILINWTVSMNFVNQLSKNSRTRIISAIVAIVCSSLAGALVIL